MKFCIKESALKFDGQLLCWSVATAALQVKGPEYEARNSRPSSADVQHTEADFLSFFSSLCHTSDFLVVLYAKDAVVHCGRELNVEPRKYVRKE